MKKALIVFAKVPVPNKVKTRLTVLITPEDAAAIYEAFLLDALSMYAALDADIRLYFSPSVHEIPPALQPAGVSIHLQKGEGLGQRMATAFAETFVAGYEAAVIIGTDHPTLPSAFIDEAFRVLAAPASIAIGPSEDGGYYLLGMNEFYPQIFDGMTYSHAQVFEDTIARTAETRATISVLPMWYDVDDPESLARLAKDLNCADAPLERTRAVMKRLETRYPSLNTG